MYYAMTTYTSTLPDKLLKRLDAAAKKLKKLKVLSISSLLGEAIRRIHGDESVSSLFV